MKEASVFEIHEQLDETIMAYVLNAKYLWQDVEVFPELLGGINRTGMQPSAVLFIPLYYVFSAFTAFRLQYTIVFLSGFWGMYFSVKRITDSSILAVAMAGCFCSLTILPIYGLSCMGVPLLFYAFLCLYDRKHIGLAYGIIFYFGLSTHLVLIGYVVLGLWGCYIVSMLWKKQWNKHLLWGFLLILAVYIGVNYQLILEFLVGNSGYVSHRVELVNGSVPFWVALKDIFINSGQHAASLHKYLILPITVLLVIEGILFKKLDTVAVKRYKAAVAGFVGIIVIAVLYAFLRTDIVAAWKNSQQGFLRFFQAERVYWLYPSLWYMEFALVFSVWWGKLQEKEAIQWKRGFAGKCIKVLNTPLFKTLCMGAILIPTLLLIGSNSLFYKNLKQWINRTGILEYTSWESYYAEDLMEQLEDAIGRDMSTYRIAHLGMSPAPSLMHGFYTVDGYSNNYSLEYKHRFRKVIAPELDKVKESAVYFDTWGNRCYLLNSGSGNYYMIPKYWNAVYENLDFDMEALKELGCEYIFSAGKILDAEEMGLESMGYFTTYTSYWGIWLYHLEE
ncbi:MAG: hypothetical protein IJZ82_03350 [Lachnospiraceae bacterium]|nr:hypothetical protein [Lachnospiraceae bacterium]